MKHSASSVSGQNCAGKSECRGRELWPEVRRFLEPSEYERALVTRPPERKEKISSQVVIKLFDVFTYNLKSRCQKHEVSVAVAERAELTNRREAFVVRQQEMHDECKIWIFWVALIRFGNKRKHFAKQNFLENWIRILQTFKDCWEMHSERKLKACSI